MTIFLLKINKALSIIITHSMEYNGVTHCLPMHYLITDGGLATVYLKHAIVESGGDLRLRFCCQLKMQLRTSGFPKVSHLIHNFNTKEFRRAELR